MTLFRWVSWIPAAVWISMRMVVEQYDGWGRWAAAPLLLVPVAVSAVFVGVALLLVGRKGADPPPPGTWIAIGIAALPMAWIALRWVSS